MTYTYNSHEESLKEAEADRLLHEAGAIIRRQGNRHLPECYSEKQLNRHKRREFSNTEEIIGISRIAMDELAWLNQSELVDLTKLAGLQEISACDDSPGVKMRLIRAMILYPWWGWWQVYWEDVNRI